VRVCVCVHVCASDCARVVLVCAFVGSSVRLSGGRVESGAKGEFSSTAHHALRQREPLPTELCSRAGPTATAILPGPLRTLVVLPDTLAWSRSPSPKPQPSAKPPQNRPQNCPQHRPQTLDQNLPETSPQPTPVVCRQVRAVCGALHPAGPRHRPRIRQQARQDARVRAAPPLRPLWHCCCENTFWFGAWHWSLAFKAEGGA
jgi:hypothetical protein